MSNGVESGTVAPVEVSGTVPAEAAMTTSGTAPFIQVHSLELKNEYEKVLHNVCHAFLGLVLNASEGVVNELGEQVKLNVGDVCNTLTNLLQSHRAANQ